MNLRPVLAGVIALAVLASTALAAPMARRPTPMRDQPTIPTGGPPTSERLEAVNRPVIPPLAAPTELNATTTVQTCTDHGGFGAGIACKALIPQGRLVLVWNAMRSSLAPDGYHIYQWRASGGSAGQMALRSATGAPPPDRTLLASVTNGGTQTLYIADAAAGGGYTGDCFAVAAFSGVVEGPMSDAYCAGAHTAVKTLTLVPTEIRATDPPKFKLVKQGTQYSLGAPGGDGMAAVGWERYEDGRTGYYSYSTIVFDPSALVGAKIVSARLKLTVDHSLTGQIASYTADTRTSCLNWIAPLTGYSFDESYGAPTYVGAEQGPRVSYDATGIVRGWFTNPPAHDYGMSIGGDGTDTLGPGICTTTYPVQSVTLEVQYQ